MRVRVVDRHFGYRELDIPLYTYVQVRLGGRAYLFHRSKPGWKGKLPFFLAYCRIHRVFYIDYPHGCDDYLLCPLCFEEWKREVARWG